MSPPSSSTTDHYSCHLDVNHGQRDTERDRVCVDVSVCLGVCVCLFLSLSLSQSRSDRNGVIENVPGLVRKWRLTRSRSLFVLRDRVTLFLGPKGPDLSTS